MKLCRFQVPQIDAAHVGRHGVETHVEVRCGIIDDGKVIEVAGDLIHPRQRTGKTFTVDEVQFLAPVVPTKIVCVGRNYAEHAKELETKRRKPR